MFQRKNFVLAFVISGICIVCNGLAFGQSDRSSVIIENEAVQRSVDSQMGNNPSESNQNNSSGLPAPGRPFNPPGVNTPQPSGFNSDRPSSIHSPNPSAFNPSSPSGVNPANP